MGVVIFSLYPSLCGTFERSSGRDAACCKQCVSFSKRSLPKLESLIAQAVQSRTADYTQAKIGVCAFVRLAGAPKATSDEIRIAVPAAAAYDVLRTGSVPFMQNWGVKHFNFPLFMLVIFTTFAHTIFGFG